MPLAPRLAPRRSAAPPPGASPAGGAVAPVPPVGWADDHAPSPRDEAPSAALPAFPLDPEWKRERRLWGHALHPMCSYLAAFPAGLPHAFIARYTRPGDVVLDPFSGRGTTPLQACAEGRIGVGNDLSPLAHLLTAAKVDPPGPAELLRRVDELEAVWTSWSTRPVSPATASWPTRPVSPARASWLDQRDVVAGDAGECAGTPPDVLLAFHPRTLEQLAYLRAALDPAVRVDRFLLATTLGILHGRGRAFLSTLMPNAFAMPPGYVRAYARATGFRPEPRDVFAALRLKTRWLLREPLPPVRGIALRGDARDAGSRAAAVLRERALPGRVRLVVSSPPYLRVVRYGASNWLRLWFLGIDPGALDATLDHAHRPRAYLAFLREVLADLREVLADDAVVVLVLGDVESDGGHRLRREVGLAVRAWEEAAEPEGYRLAGIAADHVAPHRKSTRIWGDEAGQATRTDRLLVIAPTELGRRRALAAAALPVDWRWPPAPRAGVVAGGRRRTPRPMGQLGRATDGAWQAAQPTGRPAIIVMGSGGSLGTPRTRAATSAPSALGPAAGTADQGRR